MTDQIMSAVFALLAGALVAVLLFVPFVFVNYRRRGGLSLLRTLLWIGFLVYAMALWTYTLLPLPDPDDIQCTSAQLRPFHLVDDIRTTAAATGASLPHNPAFMQVALNVLLFMPLGFFLRVLWGRGILSATATGLAISATIEVTQITGVWGIYPCPYRVFDVDDLLANTSGALLGAVLISLLLHLRRILLPAPAQPAAGGPRARGPITLGRRLTGMVCDMLSVTLLAVGAGVLTNAWQIHLGRHGDTLDAELTQQVAFWVPFLLLGAVTLAAGRTVGDLAVGIRFSRSEDGTALGPAGRAARYLAGIGAYQLADLLPGLPGSAIAFIVAVSIPLAAVLHRSRAGLPGLVGAGRPQDDASQLQPR